MKQKQYTLDELEEDVTIQLNKESQTNSFLTICSDRGLCGGVNTQVAKATKLSLLIFLFVIMYSQKFVV